MPSWTAIVVVVSLVGLYVPCAVILARYFLFRHADLIDTHRTRLPLNLATLAALLFCVCGVLVGQGYARTAFREHSIWSGVLFGTLGFFPFLAAMFSYAMSLRLMRHRLQWKPCKHAGILFRIDRLVREMGLPVQPEVVVSDRIVLPILVGRGPRSSVVVLPASWFSGGHDPMAFDPATDFQIRHELAHLRNGDLRFTTWAYTFVRIMSPLVLILLVGVCVALAAGKMSFEQARVLGGLPLSAFLVLRVLYYVVLRQRELDADTRAAALTSGDRTTLVGLLERTDPALQNGVHQAGGPASSTWRWRLLMWFADRAAFGRPRSLWRRVARLVDYLYRTHPTPAERQKHIGGTTSTRPWSVPSVGWGVWTGLVFGLALQGLLFAVGTSVIFIWQTSPETQEWIGEELAMPFCFMIVPTFGSLGLAFVALLPSRFSDEAGAMPPAYAFRLARWFGVVAVSTVAAAAFSWDLAVALLPVTFFTTGVAYMSAVAVAGISSGSRGFFLSPGASMFSTLPVVAWLALSGLANWAVPGIIVPLVSGAFVGALWVFQSPTCFSWEEGYDVRKAFGRVRRVEGRVFRAFGSLHGLMLYIVHSLYRYTIWGLLASGAFFVWRGGQWRAPMSVVEWQIAVIWLVVLTVLGMVFAARQLRPLLPRRLINIGRCCEFLLKWRRATLAPHGVRLRELVTSALAQDEWLGRVNVRLVSSHLDLLPCAEAADGSSPLSEQIAEKVLSCECPQGGFGVWPGAASRLSSMYAALRVLQRTGKLNAVCRELHLAWLHNLQQSDGTYADPLLRMPWWKQLYWGLACCQMLGGQPRIQLSPPARKSLVHGIEQGLPRGRLSEKIWMGLWCLKATASDCQNLEERLADLCLNRVSRLSELRTSWVLDEYVALKELSENSEVVRKVMSAHRVSAADRVAEALGALLGGVVLAPR